jgi:hypothetical protein
MDFLTLLDWETESPHDDVDFGGGYRALLILLVVSHTMMVLDEKATWGVMMMGQHIRSTSNNNSNINSNSSNYKNKKNNEKMSKSENIFEYYSTWYSRLKIKQ